MSLYGDLQRLEDLCATLSTQTKSLTPSLLANSEDSISTLKDKVDSAVEELESGVAELRGYVATMEKERSTWS